MSIKKVFKDMGSVQLATVAMDRVRFDESIERFRNSIRAALSQVPASPFLTSQLEMFNSLRYVDRLYSDLSGFASVLKPGTQILDIGTGCGIAAWLCAILGFDVKAIDIADFNEAVYHTDMAHAQQVLWKILASTDSLRLEFQHYNGQQIPFGNSTFDSIIGYGVIEHIPEAVLNTVMQEVVRVTKPTGYLMISYLPRRWAWLEWAARILRRPHHDRCWGDREIVRFLGSHGYSIEVLERIIFAPQFPPDFGNRHKPLFDLMDRLAAIPPFSLFARDLYLIAQQKAKS